jgi:hypothetical protein
MRKRGKWTPPSGMWQRNTHECKLPLMWLKQYGWVWTCGHCGTDWRIEATGAAGDVFRYWKKVEE